MKIHVKMSEADYLLFQKYKENAGKLRLELGSDLLQLRQEHDRLCLALLQGIEPDDSGCTIINDSLVSRAVEMAMRWRQQQQGGMRNDCRTYPSGTYPAYRVQQADHGAFSARFIG